MYRPMSVFIILILLLFPVGCNKYQRLGIRAKMGDRRAMYEYGINIWEHTSGRQDEVDEALRWITKSAEKGEPEAMYQAAMIASAGGEVDPTGKGKYWFHKGAEAGDRFCMIQLADGYRYGRMGLPVNRSEADRWYEAASRAKKPGEW